MEDTETTKTNISTQEDYNLRAQIKLEIAAEMRQDIRIKWAVIRQFEREARDLLDLSRFLDKSCDCN